jgi:uroporphyrinogen-III synthase
MATPAQWIVLTSPFTVTALAQSGVNLAETLSTEALSAGTRLATVGPATTAACENHGWRVTLQPESPRHGGAALDEVFPPVEEFIQANPTHHSTRKHPASTVVIPGAATSAGTLEPGLVSKGWTVTPVPVYVTEPASSIDASISARWHHGEYQALYATSPSVVRAVARLLDTSVPVIAIGHTTAAAALDAGFSLLSDHEFSSPS